MRHLRGNSSENPAPLGYVLYKWRRMMGASLEESQNIPLDIIRQDFAYDAIEAAAAEFARKDQDK